MLKEDSPDVSLVPIGAAGGQSECIYLASTTDFFWGGDFFWPFFFFGLFFFFWALASLLSYIQIYTCLQIFLYTY